MEVGSEGNREREGSNRGELCRHERGKDIEREVVQIKELEGRCEMAELVVEESRGNSIFHELAALDTEGSEGGSEGRETDA